METFNGFPPRAMTFLRGLKKNNRKDWFDAHRDDYEDALRAPMRLLIEDVDVRLAAFIPEIVGSKKSMFRIHRDVRFSNDKSPYKTNVACWFPHRDSGGGVGGEAVHGGAGFYFHMEPGELMCGGGIWMPPRPALNRIREVLADDYEGFAEIVTNRVFKRRFGALSGESMLTRMPRGYEPDHPAGAWLRYQSFTAGCALTLDDVQSPKLPDVLAKHYLAMTPFVRWLNTALGLRPSSAR
ncbi:MAG: DUF2461 domain-containing protein [Gemmatimonas sp.]